MHQNRLPGTIRTLLTLLLLASFIGACTGESGGGDTPTGPGLQTVAEVEFQSYQLVNSERSDQGVSPQLKYRDALSDVARKHSKSMREHDFFGHEGVNGDRLADRLRAAGITFSVAGENIVKFTADHGPAARAHDILMGSESHRSNILGPRFTRMGVGVTRIGNEYWITQVYIKP